jgi:uncharacterized membrane protein
MLDIYIPPFIPAFFPIILLIYGSILLNEKCNKINEYEKIIKNKEEKIDMLNEKEKESRLLLEEKNKKLKEYEYITKRKEDEISLLKEKESNLLLNTKKIIINEYENIIKDKEKQISILKEREKETKFLLDGKNEKIYEYENIIKNKDDMISQLKKQISEIDKYKEKNTQLEKKIKEYEIQITKLISSNKNSKISGDKNINNLLDNKITIDISDEYNSKINSDENKNNKLQIENNKKQQDLPNFKIYGFRNGGNNCYLNSSLQLLTRINELKYEIFNFPKTEINKKDNDTKGQLFDEFEKILNKIENSKNDDLIIYPENLKSIMGNIDEKYFENSQEDASEFINYFIDGLFEETSSKEEGKKIEPLLMKNESDKEAYNKYHNRFYIKNGYSFLINIFYGIMQTKNECKKCNETNLNKFSAYCMLKLPLYYLAKKKKIQ